MSELHISRLLLEMLGLFESVKTTAKERKKKGRNEEMKEGLEFLRGALSFFKHYLTKTRFFSTVTCLNRKLKR